MEIPMDYATIFTSLSSSIGDSWFEKCNFQYQLTQ